MLFFMRNIAYKWLPYTASRIRKAHSMTHIMKNAFADEMRLLHSLSVSFLFFFLNFHQLCFYDIRGTELRPVVAETGYNFCQIAAVQSSLPISL